MQITRETFNECVRQMRELSNKINDAWMLHEASNECQIILYLTKKQFLSSKVDNDLISIEYHVAFSESYGTPILCMNAWRNNGTTLTMEELWSRFNFTDGEDMYSTLTQLDHPVLQIPFLTLHPCKTADLLEDMFKSSKNVVVSWLSAVGPIVKLDVEMDYMKLT